MVEHSTRRVRIFYSWQSDRDRDRCKNFIRKAADEAAARVSERLQVNITVDADTEGIAGTPPISDTILRKIEECDIFLADMTFIAESQNGRKIPNPNVMAEYGYALKCKGLDRILLAMNTSFGSPDELPFDLRHLRHPAQYVVADGVSDSQRRNKRRQFAEVLERNFSTAIENLLTMSPPGAMPPLWDDAQAALERQAALLYAGGAPVVVRVPRLLVYVLPLAALNQPSLKASTVKAARPHFLPSADGRAIEGLDENQWWSNDPPRYVDGKPNPEAQWLFRLARPGIFESISNIGQRIDDDPEILVDGHHIESQLVNAVDRAAKIAEQVGLSGPALVTANLDGIADVKIGRALRGAGGRRIRKPYASLGFVRLEKLEAAIADQLQEFMEKIWLVGGWDDGSPSFVNGQWNGHRGVSVQ